MSADYEGYVQILSEAFRQIVRERIASRGANPEPFEQGYLLGLHRAVTLMQQTAEQFDIPADVLGFAGISEDQF